MAITMNVLAVFVVIAAILGLLVAYGLSAWISKVPEGTDSMKEIAGFIRVGAMAFLRREYKAMAVVIVILFLIIGFAISWLTAGLYVTGALLSVLAGGFGGSNAAAGAGEGPEGTMKETSADDLAVQLVYAEKVIFVPGFGLAQAQAQRELADLGTLLKDHGVEVSYAIHPVAGRMPGHMNVLLAEANVPYEELIDLDDINPQFPQANVALVVGANDVTNPAARKPGTPVSGMPILDVDKAQNVVVMKRGRGTGYAGIQNELYFEDNTQMLFGDAKASLQAVIAAVKELIN